MKFPVRARRWLVLSDSVTDDSGSVSSLAISNTLAWQNDLLCGIRAIHRHLAGCQTVAIGRYSNTQTVGADFKQHAVKVVTYRPLGQHGEAGGINHTTQAFAGSRVKVCSPAMLSSIGNSGAVVVSRQSSERARATLTRCLNPVRFQSPGTIGQCGSGRYPSAFSRNRDLYLPDQPRQG